MAMGDEGMDDWVGFVRGKKKSHTLAASRDLGLSKWPAKLTGDHSV